MKRILVSGGLLAGDFAAQAGTLLWCSNPEICSSVVIAGAAGLLISLFDFSNALFAGLTEHGETFSV
jgi:hypothetical protein